MRHFQKPDDFKAFNAFNAFNAFKKQWLSRLSKVRSFKIAGLSTLPTLAAILLLVLTGCGHNIVNYSDAIGLETTFRPDSGIFGIVIRYGKILSVCIRENTVVEMTGEGNGRGDVSGTGSASASGSVKVQTGDQVNGYTVDAIRARNGAK